MSPFSFSITTRTVPLSAAVVPGDTRATRKQTPLGGNAQARECGASVIGGTAPTQQIQRSSKSYLTNFFVPSEATKIVREGARVRVNGTTGEVTVLA